MKRVPNSKPLLVSAILAILFSFNLSIPQLMQNSEGLPFTYVSESAAKSNPFYKSAADQVIYDYFPTTEKKDPNSNTNEVINQLIDSLIQEKVAKPEICGDGQDNDGNGQIDEYCTVGDIPQGDDNNQSPPVVPEQEICGDGQDNDGNGQIDENCNVGDIPQGDDNNQSPPVVPEQEICGDGQDNDGNGQIDENCNVGDAPQGDDNNQSPPVVPEQEICGDGQDNDGNGQIDENCNVGDASQDDIPQGDDNNQSPPVVPEQEICGDGQDNDGNGQIDENCNVGDASQDDIPQGDDNNQSPPVVPEQEICGDGQDNDGNGQIDENCNVGDASQDDIPQGDDNNQSPPVVPEQEICGDGQDNDGNGQIDENCNVGDASQDNAVIKASDEKKSFDKFGVLKIFQTKKDGQQWYLKSNPNSDPQFSPQTTLTKNSDGSFKIKSMKVRMGVFTSSGFNPEKIDTLDHSKIAMAEYMQSPNDWRDVEITGYVKLNSGNNDNFVWYARGARHTGFGTPAGCEGTAYKGDLFYDGNTRWTKEQWHTGGYAFGEFGKNIGPISGKWVGLKVIMYNAVEKDKSVVKLELWVDKNNNNNWIKANEKTDKGGWGNAGRECGGKADQIITWGGPIAAFRWDGATDVDIKKFSVREIAPHI